MEVVTDFEFLKGRKNEIPVKAAFGRQKRV